MASKGTPRLKYPYKTGLKDKKKSYEVRLTAQFGDEAAKRKLQAYNRHIKERKMEANKVEWVVGGKNFNRYKMMDFIVARVANGESLPKVCEAEEMPSMQLVYSWFENHPDFEKAYKRAEEVRGHKLGEQALQTALDTDRENVAADKLRFEALSKAAARTNNRFQDRQVIEQKDEYSTMDASQIRSRIEAMVRANPELLAALPQGTLSSHPASQETPTLSSASEILDVSLVQSHSPDSDET